jgi:aminoglycoside 3-N-acetyltransferase
LTEQHELEYGLGEHSPLARLYELDGSVLLLGVGYDSCTAMHLSEYRAPGAQEIRQGAPVYEDGKRVWKFYRDIELDSDLFPEVAQEFEKEYPVTVSAVGSARTTLVKVRPLIDFTRRWFERRRAR